MPSFLEEFLANIGDNVTPDPGTGFANFLDNIVPDDNNLPGQIIASPIIGPVKLLGAGLNSIAWVDSALSRPLSTAFQASTASNPLYRDGVQLSDFQQMWAASEYLSPGRAAMTKFFSPGTLEGNLIGAMAGNEGNWNELSFAPGSSYDPYALGAEGTEEAWDSSALGTIGSGVTDFAWQIAWGKGIGVGAAAAKRAAGLSTSVRGVRDLQALNNTLDQHLRYVDTAGAEGKWSPLGQGIEDIANTRNFADIYSSPWLGRWTTAGSKNRTQLAYVLEGIDDPRLVKDVLLADRGDYAAIGRLFQQAPDHVWTLTNMNSTLRAKFIEGGQYHFTPDEAAMVRQVFDSAVQRDEFYTAVRDMFMQSDADGLFSNVARGATFKPMDGVAGRAQKWLYDNEMILRTGQTDRWIARPLGTIGQSKPLTTLMQWVGGRKPLGHISLSGLRPDEAVDEIIYYANSSKALKGNPAVQITSTLEDGTAVTTSMTMAEWRVAAIGRLGQAKVRGSDGGVYAEIEKLEQELVSAVANKYGFDAETTQNIIRGLQDAKSQSVSEVVRDGFWWDDELGLARATPTTRRQFAQNYQLLPLDEIDRAFRQEAASLSKSHLMTAQEKTAHAFDFVLRIWRTNMLFKPGYTPKNAVFEPALASLLSHGTIVSPSGAMWAFNNFMVNRARQIKSMGYKVADVTGMSGLRRASKNLTDLHRERQLVLKQLDDQEAFIQAMQAGELPPSVARRWATIAVDERRDLDRALATIEARLDEVDPIWTQVREVPGLRQLSQRLDDIEASAAGSIDTAPLREQLTEIRRQVEDIAPSQERYANLLADQLAEIEMEIGITNAKVAGKRAKREAARQRDLGGDEDLVVVIDGEEIRIPGLYNEGQFGTAIRAEASSSRTNSLTFDPNQWGQVGAGRWMRRGQVERVDPLSPDYWPELSYIANRQVRGDALAVRILQGDSLADILKWLRTPAGRKYAKGMGWDRGSSNRMWVAEDEVVDRINRINEYFPTEQSRARLLAEEDVTPAEMQRLLGDVEDLRPVHAGELTYNKRGRHPINNALNAIFNNLAVKPEDRFGRFPWLDRQWRMNVREDAQFLAQQGQEITPEVLNNLRAAAAARALKDLDNTFYNINRYSNPVFALRYLTGFPGAYYNSLYRYAKLSYQNPGRSFVMANAYMGTYESFGVDLEGNPTDDWSKTEYLAFPVPSEIADKLQIDDKVKISTRTVDFVTQAPTFLPHVMVPVSTLLKHKPTANEWMKDTLDRDTYRMFFPFDQPTVDNQIVVAGTVLDPMMSGWQMDLMTALTPGDEDFIQASSLIFQYSLAEWEQGGKVGKPPTPEQAAVDARNFFFGKSFAKFLGLSGFNSQPVGAALRDEWYTIREMFPGDVAAAREEFVRLHGEGMRYITYSTSDYRVYMPSTAEAYNRLQDNSDLANRLRQVSPESPEMVSIMFWGSQGDFDPTIYNWMADNSIPGDVDPMRSKLSPEQIADKTAVSESWKKYNAAIAKRDGLMAQYGYKQLSPDNDSAWLYNQWQTWLNNFQMDDANAQWLEDYGNFSSNRSQLALRGLTTVLADQQFMSENRGNPGYVIAARYLENRQKADAAYMAADSEQRKVLQEEWNQWVTANLLPGSTDFSGFYVRYLQGKDLGL